MYDARQILLLAAEDAFEFEKWRDAGPVIGDIDPEARAAEIAEFEALGIPMPAELDSLRRELEHAPKVSEAIRNSAIALRRSGRASASSLVALGPQQLMHPGARMGWMDPRLMAAQMAYMGMSAESMPIPMQLRAEPPQSVASRSRRPRERKLADATVVAEDGALEAEVVERRYDDDAFARDEDDEDEDDDADEDDEFELPPPRSRKRESAGNAKRKGARKAKPARSREWDDEDDDEDDDDISIVAAPVPVGSDRNTLIFGGIAAVAVIAMLLLMFNKDDPPPAPPIDPALAQQQQPPPQPAPPPAPPPQPAIDPNTGLPYGQAPAPVAEAPPPAPSSGGRGGGGGGSRGSGVRGSSTPASSGGSINPFADFKTDPAGGGPAPAGGGQAPAPAGGGQAPAPAPQPAPAGGGQAPAPADQATPPAEQPQPAEQPKPAEPPKSDDSLLTKSKMTPAIREAVVGKVGELQACYQDAMVGKPDLAGKVVFVISIDQDGVVTKVSTSVDEVGYGVAKCSAKKIKRWTLPSAGIPIIFDLPFDFKS